MYRYTPGSLSGNKLTTAMAALEVVEEFWAQHPGYRASRPVLYRRSLARHLSAAGWAASRSGRRGIAMRYLAAALVRDPADTRSWKGLVRALLVPLKAVPRQVA
jgi:hypothetical protein